MTWLSAVLQFPCQYQLYYRGKAKNTLWYDPIFQVAPDPFEMSMSWSRTSRHFAMEIGLLSR